MNASSGLRIAVLIVLLSTCLAGIPARATCDTTAPVLTGFSFTPNSINTTLASQTVTCNMTLTDALSGVSSATCTFTSPDLAHRQSCTANAPSAGTPQNGTWSCTLTFPRYSPSGVWNADDAGGATLPGVSARDAVGNSANVNPSDQGFSTALTVTSDPDIVAPALPTFTVPPGAVNVSAGPQTVTCTMTLTDAKSGVAFASCELSAPSGSSSQTVSCASAAPASGTRNNGVFSCVATIPRYADSGTWTSQVIAVDQVGNVGSFAPAASVAVTAVPEDIIAPSVSNFDFNPKTISVGGSAKSVLCTMPVADALAGVDSATCSFNIFTFVPPTDFVIQQQSCTATTPASGTRNSGTFQCSVVFPRYSAPGLWSSSVSLTDLSGNSDSYAQALQLTVDCSAGDAETTCRFAADKNTLSWDAVAGSTQYDVYRGPLTNLVDVNADHAPDGGYGTCQNSRDGNITDTAFLDSDVPTAGQKGFFYLVAYKTAGVEKGLGSNSFGTARTVAVTCP